VFVVRVQFRPTTGHYYSKPTSPTGSCQIYPKIMSWMPIPQVGMDYVTWIYISFIIIILHYVFVVVETIVSNIFLSGADNLRKILNMFPVRLFRTTKLTTLGSGQVRAFLKKQIRIKKYCKHHSEEKTNKQKVEAPQSPKKQKKSRKSRQPLLLRQPIIIIPTTRENQPIRLRAHSDRK